jgi:hypothetical protein
VAKSRPARAGFVRAGVPRSASDQETSCDPAQFAGYRFADRIPQVENLGDHNFWQDRMNPLALASDHGSSSGW